MAKLGGLMRFEYMVKLTVVFASLLSLLEVDLLASSSDSGLKLEIKAEKENLILGEPLLLEANIVNLSEKSIKFKMGGPPEIFVSKDGSFFLQYRSTSVTPIYRPTLATLNPGESKNLGKSKVFYYEFEPPGRIIFDSPGEYFVKAKYYITLEDTKTYITLESRTICIKIANPEGMDKKVWGLIHNIEFAKFLQHSYAEPAKEKEVIKTLKEIIEAYPASTYVPYIKEALIMHYRKKGQNRSPEEIDYLRTLEKDFHKR